MLRAIALLALITPMSFAQEATTASGMDKTQVDISNLNISMDSKIAALTSMVTSMQTCGDRLMFHKPSDPAADANGCVAAMPTAVQMGRVYQGGDFFAKTFTVTFPKAFANTPKVFVNADGQTYNGPCRNDSFKFMLTATNITTTGFRISAPGGWGGCGGYSYDGANWVAVDPTLIPTN